MTDEKEAVATLEKLGYTIIEPPEPQPEEQCAICGVGNSEHYEENGYDLIPVEIHVARSEEGYSNVWRWYCEEDFEKVRQAFLSLRLESHHHGSTTLIEADESKCGGFDDCPYYQGEYEEIYRQYIP